LLPPLRRIKFLSRLEGFAMGERSELFDAAAFSTRDGGRSWQAFIGPTTSAWVAGDLADGQTGCLVDPQGMLGALQGPSLSEEATPLLHGQTVRRVDLSGPLSWLAGDRGLLLCSADQGRRWQKPSGLEQLPLQSFDFRAVATQGDQIWVAGQPGTRILHSGDGGVSWKLQSTGNWLAINSLSFSTAQHGVAVGALGTILVTNDGGKNWQKTQSAGNRYALAGCFGQTSEIPLELLARVSGNEGYFSTVAVIPDPHASPDVIGSLEQRLATAISTVGGCSSEVWTSPIDTEAAEKLVRQIRTWRPELLLTSASIPRHPTSRSSQINQAVLLAVEQAAEPMTYPEHRQIGLEPWTVKKVYGNVPAGSTGDTTLTTSQLAPRLGSSLDEIATLPRALLEGRLQGPPSEWPLRLHTNRTRAERSSRDFMSGISLTAMSETRRTLEQPHPDTVERLKRTAQRRRNVDAILLRSQRQAFSAPQLLAQLDDLARDLDESSAGRIFFQLGQAALEQGQHETAAETFAAIAGRHGDHPLAPAALVWIIQYYASSEWEWRTSAQNQVVVQASVDVKSLGIASELNSPQPAGGAVVPGRVEQVSRQTLVDEVIHTRATKAVEFAKLLSARWPGIYATPQVRFPLAIAQQRVGQHDEAQRYWSSFVGHRIEEPWQAAGICQRWLAAPEGVACKPVVHAMHTTERPYLDGLIDDAIWESIRAAQCNLPDGSAGTQVKLAYDDDHLYVAVHCQRKAGFPYLAADGKRQRDDDLSQSDRIDLCLDLDHDFVTYWRLSVDHRGCTQEQCGDDLSWNPRWFVSSAGDEQSWTAEIAIPIDQLTGEAPHAGSAWAIGIQRSIPGEELQAWSQPATPEIASEGFGLLLFD
jgi:hypothetical protein